MEEQPSDRLTALRQKGGELLTTLMQIEEAEAVVAALKKKRDKIQSEELPAMMLEAEVTTLGVGNRVLKLGSRVRASLPKEDAEKRAEAIEWVSDHGHGGIVKREAIVALPKGDATEEERICDILREAGASFAVAYDIHPSSYTALCKKLVKGGDVYPDCLGIFVESIVEVEELKEKKTKKG